MFVFKFVQILIYLLKILNNSILAEITFNLFHANNKCLFYDYIIFFNISLGLYASRRHYRDARIISGVVYSLRNVRSAINRFVLLPIFPSRNGPCFRTNSEEKKRKRREMAKGERGNVALVIQRISEKEKRRNRRCTRRCSRDCVYIRPSNPYFEAARRT